MDLPLLPLALLLALACAAAVGWAIALRLRLRDVRDRLAALHAREAEVRRLRAALTGVVAHELRTPLSVILGYRELLADGLFGELEVRSARAVERIGLAAEELAHLVDGVQELLRDDAGTTAADPEPVALGAVLERALGAARAVAAERNVVLEAPPRMELPVLTTDPDRLARILHLTLTGAVRAAAYAATGERLRVGPALVQGETLLLRLEAGATPFGCYLAAPTAADAERREGPCTGAGVRLAIARRLARQLGGELEADPAAPALGLRLPVTLPAAAPARPASH
jgi:signal transduction histidine kinase